MNFDCIDTSDGSDKSRNLNASKIYFKAKYAHESVQNQDRLSGFFQLV